MRFIHRHYYHVYSNLSVHHRINFKSYVGYNGIIHVSRFLQPQRK